MAAAQAEPGHAPAAVRTVLCQLVDLPDGQARGFDPWQQGRDLLFVVRQGGAVHAWRNACPHIDGAPMAWRRHAYLNAAGDRIMCSAHGALFDIASGQCTLGPCLGQSLTPMPVRIEPANAAAPTAHDLDAAEAELVIDLLPPP